MRRVRKRLLMFVGLAAVILSGAVLAWNLVQNNSVLAESGSVTGYQQHTNGITTIGLFEVNGAQAWCFEHDKTSPSIGTAMETLSGYPTTITTASSARDQLLFKIMYYGNANGYGDIPIAMASSYVFTEHRSPSSLYSSLHETGNTLTAQDLLDFATTAPLPAGTNYLYLWQSPSNPSLQILGQYGHEDGQTVTITKIWRDNSNAYGTRPSSVRIHFYVNNAYAGYYDLTGTGNTWTQNIALGSGTVTITEDAIAGYSASYNGLSVTNTLSDTTSFSATKVWNDHNNEDGSRPTSVQLQLLQNGSVYETASVTGTGNNWVKNWTNLPKYDANGVLYTYSVNEANVPAGYTKSQSGNTITNSHDVTTSISVTKQWRDNSNAYRTRPANIQIEILQNGSVFRTETLTGTGNAWSATYSGLPKYNNSGTAYTYTVRERSTPSGYVSSQSGNTITNTLSDTTSLAVRKIWDDVNNADGMRPSSLTIELLRNDVHYRNVTLTVAQNGNESSTTVGDLPVYDENGVKYTYKFVEPNTPLGYAMTQVDDYTIRNSYRGITSSTVTKVWEDWSNKNGLRPASVTMDLLRDGEVVKSVRLSGDSNSWTHTENNLVKYKDDGTEYVYTWRESGGLPNYRMSQNGNTITNTLDAKTSTTVTKNWKDNLNAYGTRPQSIVMQLMRNNTMIGIYDMTGSSTEDHWTLTVDDLDKFDTNGNAYTYRWEEERGAPNGYRQSQQADNEITNTLTGTTSISMNKVWVDNNNKYSTRPSSVVFEVLRNGVPYRDVTLREDGNWTATASGLPMYDSDGVKYDYTVREKTNVANYTASQSGNTITNTLSALMAVRGRKIWKDNSNAYGFRPTDVALKLYKTLDGHTDRTEVTATPTWNKNGDSWDYVFNNLPMYENGVLITYSVTETVPSNYRNAIDGFDITNTLFGKVEISGTKTWKYNGAPDRARPTEITVVLLRNGIEYKTQTLTEDDMTGSDEEADTAVWEFKFSDLDKYDANGVQYEYTIQELEVSQYETTITETDITNEYAPDLVDIHVDKVWLNDNEDDRPGSIEVELLRDGEIFETVELDKETGWSYDWTDLDSNYEYTVKESFQIPGYYPGVTKGDVEHGFTIENKKIPANPQTFDSIGAAGAVLAGSTIAGAMVVRKRRR